MDLPQGPSSRLMQVKVLYTFNDENKSNCLARCQQPLTIQTAKLDPSTEIGIIELRTCIQAIVTASPELVAKLGQDYTIYAYDYSEYETPLVGQGMLSWILASSSTTPTAPADQSRTMVTGRVCKNVLALFSEGAKETLEVKLRLVPVPTCLQSEYLASMEKYRNTSTVSNQNIDTAAWATFLHANPNFGALDPAPSHTTYHAPLPLPPPAATQSVQDSSQFNPIFYNLDGPASSSNQQLSGAASEANGRSSRPTTPSGTKAKAPRKKNPASRGSSRPRGRPPLKQSTSCASRMESNLTVDTSEAEEGPARKRARITKTDWNGTSVFGSKNDSLRVTAATAASIRGSRPGNDIAHPSAADIAAGEIGERPPTPIPQNAKVLLPVAISRSRTSTSVEMTSTKSQPPTAAQTPGDLFSTWDSSPEKRDESTGSTPFEFPSSPPVMRGVSPTPSSPPLPRLPGHQDSGFVSGTIEEDLVTEEFRPPIEVPHQYKQKKPEETTSEKQTQAARSEPPPDQGHSSRTIPQEQVHPNINQSEKEMKQTSARTSPAPRPASRKGPKSIAPANDSTMPTAGIANADANAVESAATAEKVDSMALQAPDSNELPALSRQRSESCAVDATSAAGSPEATKDIKPPKPRQNSVMHQKKKQAIQDHLAEAIRSGQMPRYCKNCGAISTPTWRIVFVKLIEGNPNDMQLSEAESGIVAWEVVEKNDAGEITSFRVIKKTTNADDEGFESLDLCNSCGVYVLKHKCMRPPEVWDKMETSKAPSKPRQKKPTKPKQPQGPVSAETAEPAPAANQEAQGPNLKASDSGVDAEVQQNAGEGEAESQERARPERANSVGSQEATRPAFSALGKSSAAAALQRAIQSSPPRFPGSKFSPIEIDLAKKTSPQPTRRLLFPSPRKPGEVKSLEDPPESQQDSPSAAKTGNHIEDKASGFENDEDDGLDHLFERDDAGFSVDKSQGGAANTSDLLKTPTRRSGGSPRKNGLVTSAAKRWRDSNLGNPETPSRSGGHRGGGGNSFNLGLEQMTPFTRQLTQLISEANASSEDNDPTFDPLNPHIDVPGIFTFSDFSVEDFAPTGDDGGNALFGIDSCEQGGAGHASEGLWDDSSQDMERAMDAFLDTDAMEDSETVNTASASA